MTCKHDGSPNTTLRCEYEGGGKAAWMWRYRCTECGKATDYCLTAYEAMARARAEWWAVECSECRHVQVETRKGERGLYCYEKGYSVPTEADWSCKHADRRDT